MLDRLRQHLLQIAHDPEAVVVMVVLLRPGERARSVTDPCLELHGGCILDHPAAQA